MVPSDKIDGVCVNFRACKACYEESANVLSELCNVKRGIHDHRFVWFTESIGLAGFFSEALAFVFARGME